MKSSKLSTLLLTALFITGCGTSIQSENTNNLQNNNSFSQSTNKAQIKSSALSINLSKDDIAKLDSEYLSFSTKSLSAEYFQKKLVQLIGSDNGVANGAKIVQELEYARYKTETVIPFQAMSSANPALYTTIIGIATVMTQRTASMPFDIFLGGSNPYPAAPTGLTSTNITTTSFSANWTAVSGATSYEISIDGGTAVNVGNVLTYSVTGLTGLSHTFKVRAIKNTLTGAYSSVSNVTLTPSMIGEFRANTYTTSDQKNPSIAMDNSGNYVISWQSNQEVTGGYGIYAQRYNSAGATIGTEFRVNTYTTSNQVNPSIAMDDSGNFIVSWQSLNQEGASSGDGIYAQRYNSAGAIVGTEFQVNTFTTGAQQNPSVAMDNSGNFVVSWQSNDQEGTGSSFGVYAQRFNSSGATVGAEFQVNNYTALLQNNSSVGMDNSGNFIISWQSLLQDGSGNGIYAQRYSSLAALTPVGTEFRVNTVTADNQTFPSVGIDNSGNFIISWQSTNQEGTGSGDGIYAQRYSSLATLTPVGTEFRVNTFTVGNQSVPSVAMDNSGNFVVSWASLDQEGTGSGDGVYAQRYSSLATLTLVGTEFKANTFTTGAQNNSSVAVDNSGNFVVSWQSRKQESVSNTYGIYAQRYNSAGVGQ